MSILVFLIASSLSRSAFGSLAQARSRFSTEEAAFAGLVVLSAYRTGLLAAPIAAGIVLSINGLSYALHAIILLVALPGVLAHDAYRFAMLATGQPNRTVIIDLLWFAAMLLLAASTFWWSIGSELTVSIWLASGGLLGTAATLSFRHLLSALAEFSATTVKFASHLGMFSVIGGIPNFVFPLLAVLVVSTEEIAQMRSIETAFGVVVLANSVSILGFQHRIIESTEAGDASDRRVLIGRAVTLIAASFVFTLLATTVGGTLLELVLGDIFANTSLSQRLLISTKFAAIAPAALLTFEFVSTRREAMFVRSRLAASIFCTMVGLIFASLTGLAIGTAVVFGLMTIANLAFLALAQLNHRGELRTHPNLTLRLLVLPVLSIVAGLLITQVEPLRISLIAYLLLALALVRSAIREGETVTAALLFGLWLYTGVGVYAVEYVAVIRTGAPGIGSTPRGLLNYRGSSHGYVLYSATTLIFVRWFCTKISRTTAGRSFSVVPRTISHSRPSPRLLILLACTMALASLVIGVASRWSQLSYQNNDGIKSNPILFFLFGGLPFLALFWLDVACNDRKYRRTARALTALSLLVLMLVVAKIGARNQALTMVTGLGAYAALGTALERKKYSLSTGRTLVILCCLLPLLVAAGALRVSRGTEMSFAQSINNGSAIAQFASVDNVVDQDYRYPPLVLLREMGPRPSLNRSDVAVVGFQSIVPFVGSNTLSRTFAEPIDPERTKNGEGFGYLIITDGWILFRYVGPVFSAAFLAILFAAIVPDPRFADPRFSRLMSAAAIALIIPILRTSTGGAIGLSLRYLLPLAVLHASWRGYGLVRVRRHRRQEATADQQPQISIGNTIPQTQIPLGV